MVAGRGNFVMAYHKAPSSRAPIGLLFNIYVSDRSKGDCMQYSYADDTALGTVDHTPLRQLKHPWRRTMVHGSQSI